MFQHPESPDSKTTANDRSADLTATLASVTRLIFHRAFRLPLLFTLHLTLFSAIYAAAYFARFNFEVTDERLAFIRASLPAVVATKILVFYFGRHFHGWWSYVTFTDLRSLLKVSAASMIAVAFMDYFLLPLNLQIPRLSIILDMIFTIVVIGGLRCTWRFADESIGVNRKSTRPALLIGINNKIGQLAAQINSNQSMPVRVVGLLSNHSSYRRWSTMGGVAVLGHVSDLMQVAGKEKAKDLLILAGTIGGGPLRELIGECNAAGIRVSVLPRFEDAMSGTDKIPLRPLNIDDLLKRDPVKLDTEQVQKLISGKRVLVTGAGGSIGSEICRQVLRFGPAEVILLGRGENRIYEIYHEVTQTASDRGVILHQEIGDITHPRGMNNLFERHQPEIVFHAAAHKHVPLMELHPCEAVKNNVLGTKVIATLAHDYKCSHFVMVSSDKAVNPTSVMGATKQLAERVIYNLAQHSNTQFTTVRFGNVLGSAGSVIPRFQKQIRDGGPITITAAEMTRYFMSIPEASQLVLQAASMCNGSEIYVLDMGKPVKIVQLAKDLVTLSGLPKDSIDLQFTGIRPGEKMYEELYFEDETTLPTLHYKVRAAGAREFQDNLSMSSINALIALAEHNSPDVKSTITSMVTSFHRPTDSDPIDSEKQIAVSENA